MRTPPLSRVLLGALAAACLAGAGFALPAQGSPAAACAPSYTYAGLLAGQESHGISAVLTPLAAPQVVKGHVAGWVGVGGPGMGPGGSDEWLQIGLSAFPGSVSSIYYEIRQPDWAAKYVLVKANIAPGEQHRVAVLEMHGRPNAWRVWLDGRPVSPPVYLPGSHAGWRPEATAESWNDDAGICNNYAYAFSRIALSNEQGGWRHLASGGLQFHDKGYSMTRSSSTSFVAASSFMLRTLSAAQLATK